MKNIARQQFFSLEISFFVLAVLPLFHTEISFQSLRRNFANRFSRSFLNPPPPPPAMYSSSHKHNQKRHAGNVRTNLGEIVYKYELLVKVVKDPMFLCAFDCTTFTGNISLRYL